MEQIVIQVNNKEKAKLLFELLRSLDFVDVVITSEQETNNTVTDDDFFALAGIWEGRDIDAQLLRDQAWPHQQS